MNDNKKKKIRAETCKTHQAKKLFINYGNSSHEAIF